MQIKDCNVVASKLILVLDDLLWVLTDLQLKAMVQYAKSLSEAMEKSAQQRKSLATEEQVRVSSAMQFMFVCIGTAATFRFLRNSFTPLSTNFYFILFFYHICPYLSP